MSHNTRKNRCRIAALSSLGLLAAALTASPCEAQVGVSGPYRKQVTQGTGGVHVVIMARDDKPGSVKVTLQAKSGPGDAVLASEYLTWGASDNSWSKKRVVLPIGTQTIRLTFTNDYCGSGCPGNQDTDRNAFIDWVRINSTKIEGEAFVRDGGTDPKYPGADISQVDGRTVAGLGNQNDWAEYDMAASAQHIATPYPNAPVMLVLAPGSQAAPDRGSLLAGEFTILGLSTDGRGRVALPHSLTAGLPLLLDQPLLAQAVVLNQPVPVFSDVVPLGLD